MICPMTNLPCVDTHNRLCYEIRGTWPPTDLNMGCFIYRSLEMLIRRVVAEELAQPRYESAPTLQEIVDAGGAALTREVEA